jgi:hypothetical protein
VTRDTPSIVIVFQVVPSQISQGTRDGNAEMKNAKCKMRSEMQNAKIKMQSRMQLP